MTDTKPRKFILALPLALMIAIGLIASAHADSFENTSQAAGNSVEASAELAAAGSQVALGAVAQPLSAAGILVESTGHASIEAGADSWDAANAPLTIGDDIVLAQPAPVVPRLPQPTPPVTEPAE